MEFGATYSHIHAAYLGLDERETYLAVLDDLGVKNIRLPVYWNHVETSKDVYDWSLTDFFMDEAAKRNVNVTMVIGYKVPRWPECHIPDWVKNPDDEHVLEPVLDDYLTEIVRRYKGHPALSRWQIENEALFPFGECPTLDDPGLFRREIELVRSLDEAHPIQLTVSGEQEFWVNLAGPADIIGTSLYRFVAHEKFGVIQIPIAPWWYSLKTLIVSPWVKEVVISELQAEPWFEEGKIPEAVEEAYQMFPVERLREHVAYARATKIREVFFWGVEWWYYLHKQGDGRLWEEGRHIFAPSSAL